MALVAQGPLDAARTWHTPAGSRTFTPAPDLTVASPSIRIVTPTDPDVTAPSMAATLGAAFRQDNTVGSTLAYDGPSDAAKAERDPSFDAWKDISGTKYEQHWSRFYDVFNKAASDQMKLQIDKEETDRSTLDAAGPFGWLASLGAGIVDPTILLPGGELVRAGRTGFSLGKSALRVGLAAGAGAAVAEAGLQATQEIRPASESLFSIGGAALLGGLIGTGAAAALGRGERRAIARGLDQVVNGKVPDTLAANESAVKTVFGDAGAAAVDIPTLSDLTVKGRAAKAVTEASAWMRLNPLVRLITSPSAVVRYIGVNLFDNPIYLRMHAEGRTPGQATETLVQQYTQGAVARAMQESRAAFDDMRKRGVQMGYDEFRREVGKAGRRGDEGPQPEISAAAKSWRAHVGDPLKDAAIATKNLSGNSLLPADVAPKTALSYFSRLWNRHKIEANEPEFRGVVRDWVSGQVDERVTKLTATRDKLVSSLQQRITDAEMPAADRVAHIDRLSTELKALQASNPDHVAIDNRLTDLRRQANAATEAGRHSEATTLRTQVADIKTKAGKDYADYTTARNLAASRLRSIRNNIVGKADQVEQLRQKITDAEFANVGRLERLHRSLTILDQRAETEGADAIAEELSAARTEFAQVLDRSNKARERLVNARDAHAVDAATVAGGPPAASAVPQDFYGLLDQARGRPGADPEKRMRTRPLLALFKEKGGVDPNSKLAGELRNAGATKKNSPGLFKKGGIGAADNFVKSEEDFLQSLPDDGRGYVAEDALIAAMRDELNGSALRTPDQLAKIETFQKTATEVDRARMELEHLGVDFEHMNNDQILQHLSAVQNDKRELQRLAEIPSVGSTQAKFFPSDHHVTGVHDTNVPELGGANIDDGVTAVRFGGKVYQLEKGENSHSDIVARIVASDPGAAAKIDAGNVEFGYVHDVPVSDDYGAAAPAELTARQVEQKARADLREKLFASAEIKRIDQMNKAAYEIGELEKVDPEAAARDLRDLVAKRLDDAAGLVEREAFRIQELSRKVAAADPKHVEGEVDGMRQRIADIHRKYRDSTEIRLGGKMPEQAGQAAGALPAASDANMTDEEMFALGKKLAAERSAPAVSDPAKLNYSDYVNEIVDSVYNQITGRVDAGASRDIVPIDRGPLKERTFNIPDHLVENYLEHDAELVWRRYARMMSAEIELTKKFGSADMKDAFNRVVGHYQQLRDAAKTDEERAKLNRRQTRDVRDLAAVRDMLRGTYMAKENNTGFARMLGAVNALNYLRSMGGVVLSSATDLARPMMVHGLSRYFANGIAPLIANLRAVRMSTEDARLAGAVAERMLNTRMATWAEITDPYTHRTPFENFLENTSRGFSKANGMVYWNDFQKAFAARITQTRILTGVSDYAGSADKAYLAYLGIDQSAAERIAAQFRKFGETSAGVKVANTTEWDDAVATRIYRAAVNQDVGSIIVTKGVADTPLLSHTPIGRMVLQFKGFTLAAHQRAMIRGLQEAPAGVISGFITSTAIGAMIYYLKGIEANKPLSDNPGHWLAEGLDKSGLLPILFEINNTMEKATNLGAYRAFEAAFPGKSQQGKASRYVSRSTMAAFTGPSGDFVDTIARVVTGLQRTNSKGQYTGLNEGDVNAIARLLPFANLPVVRSIMQYGVLPPARAWAMENNPK